MMIHRLLFEHLGLGTLGQDSACMIDRLGTLGATGMGWEIDAGKRQVDRVESGVPTVNIDAF